MKKIILISIILSLTSCTSLFLDKALEKIGVFEDKVEIQQIKHKNKEILFIGMHHIGREEFYNDVGYKVDSLQKKDYVVFYELVGIDKSNDSLTNDMYRKKIRKITGLQTTKYYDTLTQKIGGKFKYKGNYKLINQPKYPQLDVDMSNAINADTTINELIDAYEERYGIIELDKCDIQTPSNSSEYSCDKISEEIGARFKDEFMEDFRNKNLAAEINSSRHDKILVIYGKNHLDDLRNYLTTK